MVHYPSFDSLHLESGAVGFWDRRQYIEMNINFANALLAARKKGEEHFTIGAIVDHSALFPKRFTRETIWSGIGSAAQMCAEETNQHDGVGHKPGGVGGR